MPDVRQTAGATEREARFVRRMHRVSGLQVHPARRRRSATRRANAGADRRSLPGMQQTARHAAGPIRTVRELLRLPRLQVPSPEGRARMTPAHATTVVAVQRGGTVAVAGDGQVTVGDIVMKARASKVRRLFHGQVVCGFAGAVADALTLFDKFEQHLDKHQGNLVRAAIVLSKEWRTDKYLRRLEAMLIVADANRILLLSGDG